MSHVGFVTMRGQRQRDALAAELAKEKEHYAALSQSMDNNRDLLGETYTERDRLLVDLAAARAHLAEAYATIRALQGDPGPNDGGFSTGHVITVTEEFPSEKKGNES